MLVKEICKALKHPNHENISTLYYNIKHLVDWDKYPCEEIPFKEEMLCFELDYYKYFLHMFDNNIIPDVVYDIGCASGFQSFIFADYMKFVGIDSNMMYHKDMPMEFLHEVFPNLSIDITNKTVISNMSLGYFNFNGLTDEIVVKELSKCKHLYIGSTWKIIENLKPSFKKYKLFSKGALMDFPRVYLGKE